MLTAKEAAEQTGNSKPAILKAIKSGRLSATKNDQGEWRIDPAELFRVYPETDNNRKQVSARLSPENTAVHSEIHLLREQMERMDAERERERRQLENVIDDLRQDRDHWRRQATALLTDGRSHERSGFWSRYSRRLKRYLLTATAAAATGGVHGEPKGFPCQA
jgi:excisionase family DNA binding protein